jgi:hypothetical protein
MNGEHFIPFRKTDFVALCAADLPADERESFLDFAKTLASLLHHRFHARIEALKEAYHPFNPQADTRTVGVLSEAERVEAHRRLEEELVELARAANFIQIEANELDRAFTEHSLLKVRLFVNRAVVDKILFFRRGESKLTKQEPIWYGLRKRTVEFTNYARVLVYVTFKDAARLGDVNLKRLPFRPGSTVIKLFQNVPRDDLEMVFPNVQVRMRGIDKVLIGVPALISGIVVIVTKLLTTLGLLLLLLAFWIGIRSQPVTLNQTAMVSIGLGLVAVGAYLVRQVTNFKNRKILFMKALSENLYFRNLDNDAGVFHHLLDAAEEAEVIETVLAYHFLRTAPHAMTAAELDHRIEEWFAQKWNARFDYEIEDGLRKLRELGLLSEEADGRMSAVPLEKAKV